MFLTFIQTTVQIFRFHLKSLLFPIASKTQLTIDKTNYHSPIFNCNKTFFGHSFTIKEILREIGFIEKMSTT